MNTKEMKSWTRSNRLLLFFVTTTICLFVSTVTLGVKTHSRSQRAWFNMTFRAQEKSAKALETQNPNSYRLPKNTQPANYKITLKPNYMDNTYKGSVTISIHVLQHTDRIVLHANDLNITKVFVDNKANKTIPVSFQLTSDKREFLIINTDGSFYKGFYMLTINFAGRMEQKLVGLYASRLDTSRTMVASKFQPTYARQAFPCFDEPEFKATYDIKLWKPSNYVALSNMNEISTLHDKDTNMDLVSFATSVPMSTYLVCFVICDFDSKEVEIDAGGIGKNFILRSFAQRQELHKIDFALDIGKRATEFYVRYYEVPFPLPKLDMIAIPDYVSGATEHWGLVTYRETSFLVDQATASASNKMSVASTITHELAHMWFGNLVTMKWWDEVWLNEGFATYMQVKALNSIEPAWKLLDHFVTHTLHSVLVTDSKLSSHPIVQTVTTPDQITSIFDTISYNKGASILRMLESFVGPENFRRGVSDYLKKYEFGNTVTHDLLSSLDTYFRNENPDLDLSYIMATWTQQMGYPVLSVKPGSEPNSYIISQTRFLLDSDSQCVNDSLYDYRWFVPITYKTFKGASQEIVWLSDKADNIKLKLKEGESLLKLNNDQVGYYRVNYSLTMWQMIIEQLKLKSNQLTPADRANLLNDVFALAESRAVPYHLALNLTSYLLVENDLAPWETAASVFVTLDNKLQTSLAYNNLQKYVQRLIEPAYIKQNWDADNLSVAQSLLRTRILSLAVRFQLPDAEERVMSLFNAWISTHGTQGAKTIHQDLRDLVYYYGMKPASMATWDSLWNIYLQEKDVQEKLKLRSALAAPRDTIILKKYLTLSWDESNVRSQDYLNVLIQISSNPSGTGIVWDEVRSRWPELVQRFTLNSRYLGNMVPSITGSFKTDLKLKEMEAFFEQYPDAGAGETARQRALENVRNNIRWNTYHLKYVSDWLQSHQ